MLDRPIFQIGHARGGSTVLHQLMVAHPDIGPKYFQRYYGPGNVQLMASSVLETVGHARISGPVERKELWDRYFPTEDTLTDMGKELIVESHTLSSDRITEFEAELTQGFTEKRFYTKSPSLSFRVKLIRQLFPNAQFIVLYRDGEQVLSSWGTKGKHKPFSFHHMGWSHGLEVLASKWYEVLDYIEACRGEGIPMLCLSYDQLVKNTFLTLRKVFSYIDVPCPKYVSKIDLADSTRRWQKRIPAPYHAKLLGLVKEGNARIRKACDGT